MPDAQRVAFERLVRTHGAHALAVARQFATDHADAEDIVQDALLQAWRRWNTFRGEASRSTWLHTIVTRTGLRRMSKRRRRQRLAPTFAAVAPWSDNTIIDVPDRRSATADAKSLNAESIAQMRTAMLVLPAPWRAALVLRDVAGLDAAAAANALGIGEATLKTRLHRGRLALRKSMLSQIPMRPAPMPIYEREMCADLLRMKLEALESGREAAALREVMCERCRAVFRELDMASAACERIFEPGSKARVRALLNDLLGKISSRTLDSKGASQPGSPRHSGPTRPRTPSRRR